MQRATAHAHLRLQDALDAIENMLLMSMAVEWFKEGLRARALVERTIGGGGGGGGGREGAQGPSRVGDWTI